MVELLCLTDSYLKDCTAHVTKISGKDVFLDRTIFYPRGGGQPSDTGKFALANGTELVVVSVSKKDGDVAHDVSLAPGVEQAPLAVGDSVQCIINWPRRYKLMRTHTAAHVLAAVMHRDLNVLISGNQLEEDKARFDFTMEGFDRGKFEAAVASANAELAKDIELKVSSLPREEAMKIPGVVKLAGALPPSITILRIVEIPSIDIQADGGTHVRNLKEVGKISISKLENKGTDNRRIYFTLSE